MSKTLPKPIFDLLWTSRRFLPRSVQVWTVYRWPYGRLSQAIDWAAEIEMFPPAIRKET